MEEYGGIVYATAAATVTLGAIAVGKSTSVVTIGATAVKVKPTSGGVINLNGTDLTADYIITNTSTAGDTAVCAYYTTGKVFCKAVGWTGGAS
jgi:hypothetical protein